MKKILIGLFVLAVLSIAFSGGQKKGKYGVYAWMDTAYFMNVPYNSGAGIVHLGIDTVAASPTFGRLIRKTASGFTNLTDFVSQNNWKTFYSDGSGDVKELSIGATHTYLRSAGASSAPAWYQPAFSKGVTIESPTSAENFGLWQTQVDITVTSINAVVIGSSPSVTINIAFGSNITSLTNVFSSGTAITNTTTGQTINSGFNDATIPAGSWIRLTSSAQSGTVTQIEVTINYTED